MKVKFTKIKKDKLGDIEPEISTLIHAGTFVECKQLMVLDNTGDCFNTQELNGEVWAIPKNINTFATVVVNINGRYHLISSDIVSFTVINDFGVTDYD